MSDQTGLIARLVVIGFDVLTAGIAEVCVPKANRTSVFDHITEKSQIMAHTIFSFVLVALSGFFVIDTFFFPKKSCFARPMDVVEFVLALIAMICGIGYIITVMVGKSTYLVVAVLASLFSVSRSFRNIAKAARAGFSVISRSKKLSVVVPEPPPKKVVPPPPPQKERIKPAGPRNASVSPYVNAIKNMELFVTGRFRRKSQIAQLHGPSTNAASGHVSPKYCTSDAQELPALVMTEIDQPSIVSKRRLSSHLHPGEILVDHFLVSNLLKFQERLSTWEFNVFKFADETKNSPLVTVTYVALNTRYNVTADFNVSGKTFVNFLHAIEEGYLDNSYHNSRHAADITQAIAYLFFYGGLDHIMKLTTIEILTLVVACACHDIAHPGVSNNFLLLTSDEIAIRYNDLHVLEQFSCSLALSLLSKPDNNFLSNETMEMKREFRRLFIDTILATDLSIHKQLTDQFCAQLDCGGFDFNNKKHRLMVLKVMIKSVDISHPCRGFKLHKQFTSLLKEELEKQAEQEVVAGLPVSVMPNREESEVAQSQIGFLENMIKPFFSEVTKFLVSGGNNFAEETLMHNINENISEWKRIAISS